MRFCTKTNERTNKKTFHLEFNDFASEQANERVNEWSTKQICIERKKEEKYIELQIWMMGHSLCIVPTQSYRWTITALWLFVGWCQPALALSLSIAYSVVAVDAALCCCSTARLNEMWCHSKICYSVWLEWLNHFVPCKLKSVEFCCCYWDGWCCFLLPLWHWCCCCGWYSSLWFAHESKSEKIQFFNTIAIAHID